MPRTLRATALAIIALVLHVAVSDAAVPYSTIKGWQDSASEALEATVLSVMEDRQTQPVAGYPNCTQTRLEFTVVAKVDVVHRSASGIQPGRTITLHNSALRTWPCPIPGGSFGEMLKGGDRVDAYLRSAAKNDGTFTAVYLKKRP